jgi:hypothetical protein
MKITDIGLLISGALGSLLLSFTSATAATLVEPIVTNKRENFSEISGALSNFLPSDTLLTFFPPNDAGLNFLNETGYTINKFSLLLVPRDPEFGNDLTWGDVDGDGKIGSSNIFTNTQIAPDFNVPVLNINAPRLELTNGLIQDGQSFALSFITNRDLTPINGDDSLAIAMFYGGFRTVPEPSNVFAFVLTMALGCWLRNRKLTRK